MAYFNTDTRKKAAEDMKIIFECAKEANIEKYVFLGFGGMLGFIRENKFIGHDNDLDICILADKITPEQELLYYNALEKRTMFFARRKHALKKAEKGFEFKGLSNVRFSWFSLRRRPDRCKICNWFWFPWNGYYWHSKGNKWIVDRKFNMEKYGYTKKDDAIMKGIPEEYIGNLLHKQFYNVNINIPERYGSCLDFWYDDWRIPKKGGTSASKVICVVGNWLDTKTWKVRVEK